MCCISLFSSRTTQQKQQQREHYGQNEFDKKNKNVNHKRVKYTQHNNGQQCQTSVATKLNTVSAFVIKNTDMQRSERDKLTQRTVRCRTRVCVILSAAVVFFSSLVYKRQTDGEMCLHVQACE